MPVAESNPLPKGQSYGTRKAQEEALSEGPPPEQQPQEPSGVGPPANVHVPEPAPNPRDLPQPDTQVVPGAPLNPEDAQVLFAPQQGQAQPQDAQHLGQWLPVLQEIAAQSGASQGMKQLAQAVTQWYGAQGAAS